MSDQTGPRKRQKVDDDAVELIYQELDQVQEQLDKLNEEEDQKVLAITKEYDGLRKPFYESRKQAIAKIPDFWAGSFENHPVIGGVLTENDKQILSYLLELDFEQSEDLKNFKLSFTFKKNPYFTNKTLWKSFSLGDFDERTMTGCNINWKKGKDPTIKGKEKAKEGEKAEEESKVGQKRAAEEVDHDEVLSFFEWFSDVTGEDDELAEEIKNLWINPLEALRNAFVESLSDDDDEKGEGEDEGEDEDEGEGEGEGKGEPEDSS